MHLAVMRGRPVPMRSRFLGAWYQVACETQSYCRGQNQRGQVQVSAQLECAEAAATDDEQLELLRLRIGDERRPGDAGLWHDVRDHMVSWRLFYVQEQQWQAVRLIVPLVLGAIMQKQADLSASSLTQQWNHWQHGRQHWAS